GSPSGGHTGNRRLRPRRHWKFFQAGSPASPGVPDEARVAALLGALYPGGSCPGQGPGSQRPQFMARLGNRRRGPPAMWLAAPPSLSVREKWGKTETGLCKEEPCTKHFWIRPCVYRRRKLCTNWKPASSGT